MEDRLRASYAEKLRADIEHSRQEIERALERIRADVREWCAEALKEEEPRALEGALRGLRQTLRDLEKTRALIAIYRGKS